MFNFPYGIDVFDENTVMVSDSDNHSIRMISIVERDDLTKQKGEMKVVKSLKSVKLEEESKDEVSPILDMLRNSAKEAAKGIRPYIIDILLGYTTNPLKQTLCTMLNLVHVLLRGEKKKYETIGDIQALLKKSSLRDDMINIKIESVSPQNFSYMTKQLTILKKNDDCKVFYKISIVIRD